LANPRGHPAERSEDESQRRVGADEPSAMVISIDVLRFGVRRLDGALFDFDGGDE
jgi:hypothetical protein